MLDENHTGSSISCRNHLNIVRFYFFFLVFTLFRPLSEVNLFFSDNLVYTLLIFAMRKIGPFGTDPPNRFEVFSAFEI